MKSQGERRWIQKNLQSWLEKQRRLESIQREMKTKFELKKFEVTNKEIGNG